MNDVATESLSKTPGKALTQLARFFVEAGIRNNWLETTDSHLPGTTEAFLAAVKAARFDAGSVVLGQLRRNYRDQGGSNTGETYPVNELCPYKVLTVSGLDNYGATLWLECALKSVVESGHGRRPSMETVGDELAQKIILEIERRTPFEPIRLTEDGDMLVENEPGAPYGRDHKQDGTPVTSEAGAHAVCGGIVDRIHISTSHDALVCRHCHLRVTFPRTVQTYGHLREFLVRWNTFKF